MLSSAANPSPFPTSSNSRYMLSEGSSELWKQSSYALHMHINGELAHIRSFLTQTESPISRAQQTTMNTLKRRRRRPASEDSSLQNQTFYFVDRNSSSSEKRSHVMRHHIQEKRRQRKLSNRSGDWRQENQIVQYLPLQHAPTSVEGDRAEISRENNSGATSNSDSSVRKREILLIIDEGKREKLTTSYL